MDNDIFKSDEAYYSDRSYLSNSSLKMLRESPTKFDLWRRGLWQQPDSPVFELGKAVHSLVLEGIDNAVTFDGRRDMRTEKYQMFLQENQGKFILSQSDYNDYLGMCERLQNNKDVRELINDGIAESPITGEIFGHKFKAKADYLVCNFSDDYIVDLKTYGKSLDEFAKSSRWMLYNQQAALYTQLFGIQRFVFVVVEKSWPYEVGVFECTSDFIDSGMRELSKSIELYEKYFVESNYDKSNARQFIL